MARVGAGALQTTVTSVMPYAVSTDSGAGTVIHPDSIAGTPGRLASALSTGRDRGGPGDGGVTPMAWLIILAAGIFETGFAVSLKLSEGMTRLWPTVSFAACALMSFALLTVALRRLEVGAAYAVWTGIGAAGAAVTGMVFLGDAVSALKLTSIGLVLAGVIGLKLSGVTPS